jgi:NAD-dependent SIR2 family protein deacetylase
MSLRDVADAITKCSKSVLVICGAGISTASGIQDFRSPGGLYDMDLRESDLPRPEALFELDFFKQNPEPFYKWALGNWPGSAQPSTTHYFLKLLYEKGKLLRCYSQNIDGLERAAGLDRRLVEAHGNFRSAHVADTMNPKPVKPSTLKKALESNTWRALSKKHGGLVKPNIVFYGEQLPLGSTRYFNHDIESAELLFVLGTSLSIAWAQELTVQCKAQHKILVNLQTIQDPWDCCEADCKRDWDLWSKLSCDEACEELALHLGWTEELKGLRPPDLEFW